MASLFCPHCGAAVPSERTWAQAAVSTLITAPAVADMATQVRCSNCGRVFAASELCHTVADRFQRAQVAVWVVAAVFAAWVLWSLLR
jgi:ribosomal protein S26